MKLFGIALALVCSAASAAKADWEYTKWGMTPAQVASAAKNLTKKSSDLHSDSDGNVTKLVMPYKKGKFLFEAQFAFDAADKLSSVTLVLNDASAVSADMDTGAEMSMPMGAGMEMPVNHGPCHDLGVSVKKSYGTRQGGGAAHMQYSIETWQDAKNKNNVKYTVLARSGCYVQYSAIKPAGSR
jgi:hypothetical protein